MSFLRRCLYCWIGFGLPYKILKFIRDTFSRRYLTGFAGGVALQRRFTTKGLPQGLILSPILFNIVSIIHLCLPDSVKILAYADDIVIYCSSTELSVIEDRLNLALAGLSSLLKTLELRISPAKSYCTIFSRLRSRNLRILIRGGQFAITVDNETVPFSYESRYLGIYLDPELNWKAHINQLRNRTIPRINVLKAMAGIR